MDNLSEIVGRARRGDADAFAALVAAYSASIFALVRRSVTCDFDADDIAQSCFVRAYGNLHALRDDLLFPHWLKQIAANEVRTWHRRRLRQATLEDRLVLASHQRGSNVAEANRIRALVHASIRSLPPTLRDAVVHHYLQGQSYVATAGRLGIGVEAVRSRLRRARTLLRKGLIDMSTTQIAGQSFRLQSEDLGILRAAARLTSPPSGRPVLQGILIEPGGKIVASNAHGLFVRTVSGLDTSTVPVIVGPWDEVDVPDVPEATLVIDETGARLDTPESEGSHLQIIDGPFVQYEKVIKSQSSRAGLYVDASVFRDAVESLADHMHARHPIPPGPGWEYSAMVELLVSPLDGTVSLITRRDMGYCCELDGERREYWPSFKPSEGVPSPDAFNWEVRVTVDCEVVDDEQASPRRVYLDYSYFNQLVNGLTNGSSGRLGIFFEEGSAVLLTPAEHPDWSGLLMPLRVAS